MLSLAAHRIRPRALRNERDWWAVRALLVDSHTKVPCGWNWDIRRWDGWRFHREPGLGFEELAALMGVWETPSGLVVGAVHPEDDGEAFLELDPEFRSLEEAMVRWAEDRLARTDQGIAFWVMDDDEPRRHLLATLGYRMDVQGGWVRTQRLPTTRAEAAAPLEHYEVRTTTPSDDDCARMADLLNGSFGRTVHTAAEYRAFMEDSPSFDHELNLVAVAADGSFAAHVGLTYDAVNRHGMVEPVSTHPDHRRAGLARHLLMEGIARLEQRGAETAELGTGDQVASNALYAECGFTEARHFHRWQKGL